MQPNLCCEVCGFWIAAAGWLLLVLILVMMRCERIAEAIMLRIDRVLGVPVFVQLVSLPLVSYLLLFVGWHIHCIGNAGRYPGYPLDVVLHWLGA